MKLIIYKKKYKRLGFIRTKLIYKSAKIPLWVTQLVMRILSLIWVEFLLCYFELGKCNQGIGIVSPNFLFRPPPLALGSKRTELSEFIFGIIHNWGRHFVRVSRMQADERWIKRFFCRLIRLQRNLNLKSGEHSRCRLDRTIFRRINRPTGIFENARIW